MSAKKKVTLVMEESVVYGIRQAIDEGVAKSQSGLVQAAVIEYLEAARRRALADAYAAAAQDPRFLSDLEQVSRDFQESDAEIERY